MSEKISWLSPNVLAEMSGGLLSAYQIRSIVDQAIADPSSKLKPGVHYMRIQGKSIPRYKVSEELLQAIHQ